VEQQEHSDTTKTWREKREQTGLQRSEDGGDDDDDAAGGGGDNDDVSFVRQYDFPGAVRVTGIIGENAEENDKHHHDDDDDGDGDEEENQNPNVNSTMAATTANNAPTPLLQAVLVDEEKDDNVKTDIPLADAVNEEALKLRFGWKRFLLILSIGVVCLAGISVGVSLSISPGPLVTSMPPPVTSMPPPIEPNSTDSPFPTTTTTTTTIPTITTVPISGSDGNSNLKCEMLGEDWEFCVYQNAVSLVDSGNYLASIAGSEVSFWERNSTNKNKWVASSTIPPLPLAEPLTQHQQNLDFVSLFHEDVERYFVVALAYGDFATVHMLDTLKNNKNWTQLGSNFIEFDTPPDQGYNQGAISVELATNASSTIVFALAAADVMDSGNSNVSIYEYDVHVDSEWNLIGEEIPCFLCSTENPVQISLADNGSMIAIGIMGYTGSGEVRVYGRSDQHYTESCDQLWCRMGSNEIVGGDYEDFFAASIALSSDGSALVVGAPGSYDCTTSLHCSIARIFSYAENGVEPRWISVGQALEAKDGTGTQISGFGDVVKISPTGDMVAVARHNHFDGYDSGSGGGGAAWYIWTADENGSWVNTFVYDKYLTETQQDPDNSYLAMDFVVTGDDDKKGENYTLAFSFLGNVTVASW
jgi:hypothetical protein